MKKGICDICRASLESLEEQIEENENEEEYICEPYKKHICRCGGEIWILKKGKKVTFYCDNVDCDYIQELDTIDDFL